MQFEDRYHEEGFSGHNIILQKWFEKSVRDMLIRKSVQDMKRRANVSLMTRLFCFPYVFHFISKQHFFFAVYNFRDSNFIDFPLDHSDMERNLTNDMPLEGRIV